MIRVYYKSEYKQEKVMTPSEFANKEDILWIDLHKPQPEEIEFVEREFNVKFPTKTQQEEIEISSRFAEMPQGIVINSTVLQYASDRSIQEHEISIIQTDKVLFTIRYFDSRIIAEAVKKIKSLSDAEKHPSVIMLTIFGQMVDFVADLIETVSKNIAVLNRKLNNSKAVDEAIVIQINDYQEQLMTFREVLFDKQRVLNSILRMPVTYGNIESMIRVVLKDISSLLDHTNFNFTRLEYMQNNFIGLINIEQNKIIKLFTVASVIFMPPTLIASIYGMNFNFMPELHFKYGYFFSILLMITSSLVTLMYFKRKKWL